MIARFGLWAASLCAAFAIGVCISKASKPHLHPPQPSELHVPPELRTRQLKIFQTSLDLSIEGLGSRENRIRELESELAALRAKIPPPLSPKEKEWRKKWEERCLRQKRYVEEGGLELYEGQHELQKKVHQRRDKGLRAQGLEELATLMASDKREDVLRGLSIFRSIDFEAIGVDKATYEPWLLDALKHDDAEVRRRGLESLGWMYPKEEVFEAAVSLLDDPAPEVRREATFQLVRSSGKERNDHVATALKDLLGDKDPQSRQAAVWRISALRQEGFDYSAEMEDALIEASRDTELTGEVLGLWREKTVLSAKVTERVAQMLNAPYDEEKMEVLLKAPKCEALRPQAIQAYIRILRECLDVGARRQALQELLWFREKSVIAQLEDVAGSFDAEGIEKELAQTIQSLKRYSTQPD